MPHYSVAKSKDQYSSLIEKALAGEEVVITRHGQPIIEFRPIVQQKHDRQAAMERIRLLRESLPPMTPTPLHRFSEWLYEDEED